MRFPWESKEKGEFTKPSSQGLVNLLGCPFQPASGFQAVRANALQAIARENEGQAGGMLHQSQVDDSLPSAINAEFGCTQSSPRWR